MLFSRFLGQILLSSIAHDMVSGCRYSRNNQPYWLVCERIITWTIFFPRSATHSRCLFFHSMLKVMRADGGLICECRIQCKQVKWIWKSDWKRWTNIDLPIHATLRSRNIYADDRYHHYLCTHKTHTHKHNVFMLTKLRYRKMNDSEMAVIIKYIWANGPCCLFKSPDPAFS